MKFIQWVFGGEWCFSIFTWNRVQEGQQSCVDSLFGFCFVFYFLFTYHKTVLNASRVSTTSFLNPNNFTHVWESWVLVSLSLNWLDCLLIVVALWWRRLEEENQNQNSAWVIGSRRTINHKSHFFFLLWSRSICTPPSRAWNRRAWVTHMCLAAADVSIHFIIEIAVGRVRSFFDMNHLAVKRFFIWCISTIYLKKRWMRPNLHHLAEKTREEKQFSIKWNSCICSKIRLKWVETNRKAQCVATQHNHNAWQHNICKNRKQ